MTKSKISKTWPIEQARMARRVVAASVASIPPVPRAAMSAIIPSRFGSFLARYDILAWLLSSDSLFAEALHEVRSPVRAPAAAPLGRLVGAPAVPGSPRPGRARRPAGHRLHLGGRAPFPRGIRALLGPGSLPRGLRGADLAHPHRPWRRAGAARLQPPGPRRRADRDARSRRGRPRRLGHRRVRLA